jgi:hypothetical protein
MEFVTFFCSGLHEADMVHNDPDRKKDRLTHTLHRH